MTKDKWLMPAVVAAIIATYCLIVFVGNEEKNSYCQYANSFTDARGQTWSATDIKAENVGCMEAIKVAVPRAEQSVGLGPASLPTGWSCDEICFKGKARVSFTLALK